MQPARRTFFGKLLQDAVLAQHIPLIHIDRIADVFANSEAVFAFFQHIRRFLNHALIVINRKRIRLKRNSQRFALARFQQMCLCKANQRGRRLRDSSLRRIDIRLQDIFARACARIRDLRRNRQFARVVHPAGNIAERKRRVAQAKAERIAHGICRIGNRFKIAIADEHILLIFHIQRRLRKIR